jgi:DNA-binding NtrC family response regulator
VVPNWNGQGISESCFKSALEGGELTRELSESLNLSGGHDGFGGLLGTSPEMCGIYRQILKLSSHRFPVLILGETGTGKELVARSIHYTGSRRNGPFVPVDCSSLSSTLIESELFGYVQGAFTGAVQSRLGVLEFGDGGTIFLDEIDSLHLEMQPKLLRALQENEIRPVGSARQRHIDIRVIAATSCDLRQAVQDRTFREDLYFRLNVAQICLPPLRHRKSDIPLLADHFLGKYNNLNPKIRGFSSGAAQFLMEYEWPGNVRELENVVQRALALSSGSMIEQDDLLAEPKRFLRPAFPGNRELTTLEELEQQLIFKALNAVRGNKGDAARILGIGKTTLYRKLREYKDKESSG